MARCSHVQWLDLDRTRSHWTLAEPRRLQALLNELARPDHQRPSVVLFVGRRVKATATKHLYKRNNVARRKTHGVANMLLDYRTDTAAEPILFADCTWGAPCGDPLGPWTACHESRRYPIAGETTLQDDIIALTHLHLIFPFTHLICMFADDLGGNEPCTMQLKKWLRIHSKHASPCPQSNVLRSTRPHLLIIASQTSSIDELARLDQEQGFGETFDLLRVVSLDNSVGNGQWDRFQCVYDQMVADSRQTRKEAHLLFSASALANAFSTACELFSQDPTRPVDFLESSRHPIRTLAVHDVHRHLLQFLSLTLATTKVDIGVVIEQIAAAWLVQGFPQAVHSR